MENDLDPGKWKGATGTRGPRSRLGFMELQGGSMTKPMANQLTAVLGIAGILLILAGPAFHLLASTPALFFGLACFVVAGAVKAFVRNEENEEREGT